MHEGGTQVVVALVGSVVVVIVMVMVIIVLVILVLVIVVIVPVMMMMVVIVAQEEGAHQIDREAQKRDRDRLVERDRDRVEQPGDRLVGDQQRDHREHDRAGEGGEVAELAGAERRSADRRRGVGHSV